MTTGSKETTSTELTKLSDVIAKPIEKLFQVGGLTLVFIFVGFFSMLVGYLYQSRLSTWLFSIGSSVVFACLCLFMFSQIYAPVKARRLLRENKQLIDSVQDVAIKLTESLSDVQSLMFKHYEHVGRVLETAAPILSQVGLFRDVDFGNSQNLNSIIVDSIESFRVTIDEVKLALITCNISRLKQYSESLMRLRASMRDALKQREHTTTKLVNYKETLDSLRRCVLEYSETIQAAVAVIEENIAIVDSSVAALGRLPIVGKKLERVGLVRAQQFLGRSLRALQQSKQANINLHAFLENGDIEAMRVALEGFKSISAQLRDATNKNRGDVREPIH